MRRIREVESALIKLFADSEVPGFIHLSIGQEGVAAGVMSALKPQDTIATTHRGHGHVLARGLDLGLFFGEIMGKAGGICGGRGGSMHVSDMALGIIGANGIVGAGIPIALGSALAHDVKGNAGVAVAFFGDGAMAEGVLHETMNLAAIWKLPLLLVCENNGWSEFSPTSRQFVAPLEAIAGAFGLPYARADGAHVLEVADVATRMIKGLREGAGAAVLECSTKRVRGHYEGDPQKYRDAAEIEALDLTDPLIAGRMRLLQEGTSEAEVQQIDDAVAADVQAAVERARSDALPEFEAALSGVYGVSVPNQSGVA
ncbi:thiamine pyrophosphate-dependent dehydrogenase E1 component subunit alpha [Acidovorax sp. JHL-9]|uniref:thiamine pyrophosphate-dependent dehydrogenase E1 component subunit alpha n=1 Tax=Acidovorax sp. JHL-9 TaxID=1276756 RepID=UPI0003FFBCEB|nr:thiamine pyrophosphate-dependent dehydrogenase E1 component subunit alpha [Acidovorax sp. JHL-9]